MVIALVVVVLNVTSGGKDTATPKPAPAPPGGGPVTLTAANRDSVTWGPKCDVKRGSVAVPLTFAPPCVKPFTGDNGGATSPGVTADTITVALYQSQPDIFENAALARSGSDESLVAEAATVQQYIDFFEAHYETYGRKVKLVVVKGSGDPGDDAAGRADAIKVATEVKAFASFGGPSQTEAYAQELAARGVLCLGDCMLASSQKFVDQRAPNIWLTLPAVDQSAIHWAKFVGGELSGHPAQYAGDAALAKRQRVFGLVRFDESFAGFQEAGKQFLKQLINRGVKVAVDAPYELDLGRAQENARNTIAKLKSAGVTTVMFAGDPLTPSSLTTEATAQKYFPEWVILGAAYSDTSLFGRTYDKAQWKHAFGVSSLYVPTPAEAGPVLRDPAVANRGRTPGQDLQAPRPSAPDLLHGAPSRRTESHPGLVPRRALPLPVGQDRPESDPPVVGPSRHLAQHRLLRRRRRDPHLVEPGCQGHRRGRQRRVRHVGVRRRWQALPAEAVAQAAPKLFDAVDLGDAVRSLPRGYRSAELPVARPLSFGLPSQDVGPCLGFRVVAAHHSRGAPDGNAETREISGHHGPRTDGNVLADV